MADQAAVLDWRQREEKRLAEREAQDRANREDPAYVEFFEAYAEAAGKRAAGALYGVAEELGKKRPVLKEIVTTTARELDTLFFVVPEWPSVKERLAGGSTTEAEIARLLYDMPQSDRPEPVLMLAELIAKREAINVAWEKVERAYKQAEDGDGDNTAANALREEVGGAEGELRTYALNLIANGHPHPAKIAKAVLGRSEVRLEGIPLAPSDDDRPAGSDTEAAA